VKFHSCCIHVEDLCRARHKASHSGAILPNRSDGFVGLTFFLVTDGPLGSGSDGFVGLTYSLVADGPLGVRGQGSWSIEVPVAVRVLCV